MSDQWIIYSIVFMYSSKGAVEIPAGLLCIFMMDRKWFGRRITCSFALLMCGIASLANIGIILDGGMLNIY